MSETSGQELAEKFVSEAAVVAAGGEHADALQAFRLLNVIAIQLRRMTDDLLRDGDVTMRQATMLTIVDDLGRPTISAVAAAMSTSHQNVKQIAVGLARRGLLTIEPDEHDGRVRRLATTEANARFWAERDPVDVGAIAAWFAPLGRGGLATLNGLLDQVRTSLAAHEHDRGAP